LTLRFLRQKFKDSVERPYKQLAAVAPLWCRLLPPELLQHTRLEGLSRGALRVAVDCSSRLYELDRLLRSGLEQQIVSTYRSPTLRRIVLRVAHFGDEPG
jgi:hypothetical protein